MGPPSVHLEGFADLELIGSGGYSQVYRARQIGFDRVVALKVLSFGIESADQQRTFERECRAMGALSEHPNIVTVFNAAVTGDRRPCIVMELYPGGTLGDRMRDHGPIELSDLLSIGVQVSGALQTAHDRGVVHRDIKPQNIFLSEYGQPALGDFGISSFDDDRTITGAGGGLTVHYAPPELIEGESATPSSDVYSLAASLYTLASGRRPYPRSKGQSVGELARRILIEPPPRLPGAYGSHVLSDLLESAMAKQPSERPLSAHAFGQQLQAIQHDLGLGETMLPIPSTVPVKPIQSSPAPVSEPEPPASSVEDGRWHRGLVTGDPNTATIARRPEVEVGEQVLVLEPENGPRLPRRTRSWVFAAVAVAAIGLPIIWVATTGETGAQESDATTETSLAAGALSTDDFFSAPATPTDLAVTRGADGSAEASWALSDGAVRYQVTIVGVDEAVETVEPSADVPSSGLEPVCLTVTAVGEGGKLSRASATVCG